MNLRRQESKNKGFTLLELLVVIGIIALLVSFAAVSYSAAQVRTRDSRRKADLNSIKDALEQYYSANSFVYPTGDCTVPAQTYLKSAFPADPGTYTYSGTGSCVAASFCICAQLETGSGGNSTNSSCSWGSGAYFCVANQQ